MIDTLRKEENTMTQEQKEKFEALIKEYEEYISAAHDEKTAEHYKKCLADIKKLYRIISISRT